MVLSRKEDTQGQPQTRRQIFDFELNNLEIVADHHWQC